MTQFHIRSANLHDLHHLVHHRRAMFEDMGHRDPAELNRVDQASQEYFTEALHLGTYKAWLAETSEGRVVAGGGTVIANWPGYPGESLAKRAWILNMYTEPEARRQGIAKQLLQTILDWCRNEGFRSVSLHASPAGRPLYESLGFQPTNEMPPLMAISSLHSRAGRRRANQTFDLARAFALHFHCSGNMKISDAVTSLAALAQETRLDIFRLLVRHAPNGLPAGTIARQLRLPSPTLSFHLNVLAAAELIRPHKNGRSISYSPILKNVNQLTNFLMENCCGGQGGCGPSK